MPTVQERALNPGWEKFFFLLLLINPFFDFFTGVYLNIATQIAGEKMTDLITPTLIVRMLIILVFAAYVLLLRDKKSILLVGAIVAAFVLSVVSEYVSGKDFSLFTDLQYIAKFVYNVAVILVFWRVFQRSGHSRETILNWLNWLFSFVALLFSSTILLAYAFRIGFYTYGDRFGFFGSRGFFYSGNDITAVLMILLPLCMATYFLLSPEKRKSRKHRIFYLFAPATALGSLFLIGTKTSFLAMIVTVGAFFVNALIHRRKEHDNSRLKMLGIVLLTAIIIFAVMSLVSLADPLHDLEETLERWRDILDESGVLNLLTSGRIDKLKDALVEFRAGGPFSWLFGIGRGTQAYIIEMDLCELLLYYGLFGFVVMSFLYFKLGMNFLRRFRRKLDLYTLACFLSIGLCAGYLIIAGHVLFSVTSGFYFALMLLYAQLYLADEVQDVKIL